MIWDLRGTTTQVELVQRALAACDFPFDKLGPSLVGEGKSRITVEWADLSRYNHTAEAHDHADGAHTVSRDVGGRSRVLGLFYLPPHTRVVLDNSLTNWPILAQEVFLAEAAHAVDYNFMVDRNLRVAVWNALHADHEDTTHVPESGDINHGHSWFDGPAGYSTWTGEAWMALFIKTFAPSIPVSINLAHPISDEAVREVRAAFDAVLNPPEAEPVDPPRPPVVGGGSARVFRSSRGSQVVHDVHRGLTAVEVFASLEDAVAAGMRPCRVCKP